MAWIKSYQEIERHPKTIVLMKEMNWPLDVAISKLHRLWWWCADYANDGDISRHDPDTIATAIGCADMKGEFLVAALVKAGFVDKEPNLRLHDWWAHFGDYLRGKYARNPDVWKKIEACYTNATPLFAERLPNTSLTLGNSSPLDKVNKERKKEKEKGRVAFAPPTLIEVQAYCTERGNLVNAAKWLNHYESNGWKVGKNPMKDWKAAVRTWEHSEFGNQAQPAGPSTGEIMANKAKAVFAENAKIDKVEAFHREHTAGGKCSYCGKVLEKFGICDCPAYLKGWADMENIGEIK